MKRRDLLLALPGLTAAGWAQAKPADAGDATAAAQRLAVNPLMTPFIGVTDITGDRHTPRLATIGRWPEALRGRFYRNGPALFERGGQRYHHWFDGDGMVQQFSFNGGQISHRGRLVQTLKLKTEREAGRFLFDAFGTTVPGGPPITGADSVNTANTNALEHGGRVLALWEGGSAYALDPADLSTQGPVTWRKDLAGLPFTAHPKVDAHGNLWNIGTQGPHMLVWQIGPDGQLRSFQHGKSPYPGGMVHDMAVTERWIVVPLPPVKLDFGRPVAHGARRFALEAGQPLRILVMDKADIKKQQVFELPAQMVFHVGNAHEEADGTVVLSFVAAPDASFLDQGAVALMAGKAVTSSESRLQIARLDMGSGRGRVQTDVLPGDVEFPRMDPRRIGKSAAEAGQWLLCAAGAAKLASVENANSSGLFSAVQMVHLNSGRTQRWNYGPGVLAEEHILIPKPGRGRELDAWVLGTTFDSTLQATVLNLLDAAHLPDGPIAQATLPYVLPLGFHGNFTAA